VVLDITERRLLEDQYRQAQKMEAVGRLAGGVAHDFNNLLTVITGFASFVTDSLADTDPRRRDVEQIQRAATDATRLTRQLLAFSRQQVVAPRVVALDAIVDGARMMLRRVIGEDIRLVATHGGDSPTAFIDPGQVEQAIMNLVVNARDAMPTGGTLTIQTGVVDLDETAVRAHGQLHAGTFALLAVADTGTGMDAATRAKIFEPFFTTKPVGMGTGLGLATVYGMVTQAGGFIDVESAPGAGTTFRLFLPHARDRAPNAEGGGGATGAAGSGTETILVVEDAESVRATIKEILERKGYCVLEAATGSEALALAASGIGIDLLLTDVVMPEISGRLVAERFEASCPGAKVLFMSGYTDDAVVRHGILSSAVEFIEKPFAPEVLARKVRSVLDAR
jgi:nitrogen-specific signal transduction histidine kinase